MSASTTRDVAAAAGLVLASSALTLALVLASPRIAERMGTLAAAPEKRKRAADKKPEEKKKTTTPAPSSSPATTTAAAPAVASTAASEKSTTSDSTKAAPTGATSAVLVPGNTIPDGELVRGYEFGAPGDAIDWDDLLSKYETTGYQGTNLGRAIKEIKKMRAWRLSDDEPLPDDAIPDLADRQKVKAKIFFGYTSNLISSGLRESFCFLAKHKMVDVVVSSAGGIEEDFIKCMAPTYTGDFTLSGMDLRSKGLNRIGNLLVPNSNYCKFEDWMNPILDAMLKEQREQGVVWTPSKMIHRLGKEINDERSVYYWCYKNNIPVYCPALTDGSIGDMMYFHSYTNPGLVLDIVGDIRAMNDEAVNERKTGIIILGGGMIKHHICNANLMRNGADFAVYVNTAQEFDGCDSGASPDEAVSWGKIRPQATAVKVHADATIVFPLLVAATFAKEEEVE